MYASHQMFRQMNVNSRAWSKYEHVCLPHCRKSLTSLATAKGENRAGFTRPVLAKWKSIRAFESRDTGKQWRRWRKRRRCEESLQRRTAVVARLAEVAGLLRPRGPDRLKNLRFFSFGGIVHRFDLASRQLRHSTLRRRSASGCVAVPRTSSLLPARRLSRRRTVHNVFPLAMMAQLCGASSVACFRVADEKRQQAAALPNKKRPPRFLVSRASRVIS